MLFVSFNSKIVFEGSVCNVIRYMPGSAYSCWKVIGMLVNGSNWPEKKLPVP